MKLLLKSVVFKTNDLKKTMDFFVTHLGLTVTESSIDHFVIQWKTIRVLFIYSDHDQSSELYFASPGQQTTAMAHPKLTVLTDPNGIKVIIVDK